MSIKNKLKIFGQDFEIEVIGDILKNFIFVLPPSQRKYTWSIDQWWELWDDLIGTIRNKDVHFFGPMFFIQPQSKNKSKIYILDGQQRLVTISSLLILIRDLLYFKSSQKKELNKDSLDLFGKIDERLFYGSSINKEKRLHLESIDNDIFEDLLKSHKDPILKYENLKKKFNNHLILKCYRFYIYSIYAYFSDTEYSEISRKKIKSDELVKILSKENFDKLCLNFYNFLTDSWYILRIIVPSYDIKYEIFETLNQRGLKLEVKDLFRNIVFEKLKEKGEKYIKNLWNQLENYINDFFDEFLLHYWRSKFEFIRIKNLFRYIRSKIGHSSVEEFERFLKEMINESMIYSALRDYEDPLWKNKDEIKEVIEEINYLGFKQVLPLILSSYITISKDESKEKLKLFGRLLKTCLNFSVRRYTVLKSNPSEYEKKYSEMARDLRNNSIKIEDVIHFFKDRFPSDSEFKKRFIGLEIKSPKVVRYILCKINDFQLPTKIIGTWKYKPTVEHIIPKKPDKNWKKYLKDQKVITHEKIVNRLGNYTILSKKENEELGNLFFSKKRELYIKKDLPINKIFQQVKDFNEKTIIKREEDLGEISPNIWKN